MTAQAQAAASSSAKAKKSRKASSKKKPSAQKSRTASKKTARRPSSRKTGSARGSANANAAQFQQASNSLQSFGEAFTTYAQAQMEDAMAAAQQLLNCRTLEDMAAVQSQFVQGSFDRFVKQANNLAQSSAAMAKNASAQGNPLEEFMQRFRAA